MSYIQITTRCNMSCDHCCMSCGKQGDDMTRETWHKALEFAGEWDICIGGGEPTLHKHFREFLLDAIEKSDCEVPTYIATNGKTKHAELLYKLTKSNAIMCDLSQDEWHDPIDIDIVEKFKSLGRIRDVSRGGTKGALPKGRALETGVYENTPNEIYPGADCPCPDWLIDPKGGVHACGCLDAPELFNLHDDNWSTVYDELMKRTNSEIGTDCWYSLNQLVSKELV